jgi:GT2 family glycosyltransferase
VNVDVVIVSYNSEQKLPRCLDGLASAEGVHVAVVDNASQDGSLEVVARYAARAIALDWNSGFAHGCNVGWKAGAAPFVLFLNPDAAIDAEALSVLVSRLEGDDALGLVAPRIVHEDGTLSHSLRRYPSLPRAFAQALFLHRLVPRAAWADEVVRDPAVYDRPGSPDWVSGACLLIRRSLLETIGGFDERFFLYSEDVDLCRQVREAGAEIRYEPAATCVHAGGASAPPGHVLPLMAKSRQLYARKYERPAVELLYVAAATISALTHAVVARDRDRRKGHIRAIGRLAGRGNGPRGASQTGPVS